MTDLRHSLILKRARRDGVVRADQLADELGVAVQTIRRDLRQLSTAGVLERTHGGAALPSGVRNVGHRSRRGKARDAKARIGAAVAQAIPDDASLFLNIGTTTEAVARALMQHRRLMVVTNNLNVANILAENESAQVIVAGGKLRRSDGGLVGELTADVITRFKVDLAVIGTSAIDDTGDLLDFDADEVRVSQTILAQARTRFLVADAGKFNRAAAVRIGSLSQIDRFYTDAALPEALLHQCQDWNTRVLRV